VIRRPLRAAGRAVCVALLALPALAHDGPPYPILVDEQVAGWTLSVWADPDVGTGTFYYYVSAPPGQAADALRIQAISVPADGAAPQVTGQSEPAQAHEPFQHVGTLEFAYRGKWPTRFVILAGEAESMVLGELAFDLDVTPPGLGALDILWFAFPFLAIGGLWLRVLLGQRAHDRAHSHTPSIDP